MNWIAIGEFFDTLTTSEFADEGLNQLYLDKNRLTQY